MHLIERGPLYDIVVRHVCTYVALTASRSTDKLINHKPTNQSNGSKVKALSYSTSYIGWLFPTTCSAAARTAVTIQPVQDGRYTQLDISTKDRPGLLTDIVGNLKNLNINVVSAEVDTIGDEARDTFYITYHGEALSSPMETLVVNVLQYHLSLAEMDDDDSY